MQDDKKSTVVLNRTLRKRAKEQCAREDISMRELMECALENELRRRARNPKAKSVTEKDDGNDFALGFMRELEKIVKSRPTARAIFMRSCMELGINPPRFSRLNFTKDYIEFICMELSRVAKKEDIDKFCVRLRRIYKGRGSF